MAEEGREGVPRGAGARAIPAAASLVVNLLAILSALLVVAPPARATDLSKVFDAALGGDILGESDARLIRLGAAKIERYLDAGED